MYKILIASAVSCIVTALVTIDVAKVSKQDLDKVNKTCDWKEFSLTGTVYCKDSIRRKAIF